MLKTVTLKIDQSTLEQLDKYARRHGMYRNEVVREMLAVWKEEKNKGKGRTKESKLHHNH